MTGRTATFLAIACLGLAVVVTVLSAEAVSFAEHVSRPTEVASPDGKTLAKLSGDRHAAMLCDATTGKERASLAGDRFSLCSGAFSPDGKILAVEDIHGFRLWDVATGKERVALRGQSIITCVAFSPDGTTLASGDWGDHLYLWDVASGERRFLEKPWWLGDTSVDYPTSVAFSPDGKTLASIVDERVGLWDARSGKHTATLDGGFRQVALTTDGKLVALAESSNRVKIWEVSAGWTAGSGALLVLAILLFARAAAGVRITRQFARVASPANPGGPPPQVRQPQACGLRATFFLAFRCGVFVAFLLLVLVVVCSRP